MHEKSARFQINAIVASGEIAVARGVNGAHTVHVTSHENDAMAEDQMEAWTGTGHWSRQYDPCVDECNEPGTHRRDKPVSGYDGYQPVKF